MCIELVLGDITEQRVGAIVNAANSILMGGGGEDGAIHDTGGPEILEECRMIRRERYPEGLPTGQAVATSAGRLPAKWVIHTVGPVYSTSEDRSPLLASCHTGALRVADELGGALGGLPRHLYGGLRLPGGGGGPGGRRRAGGSAEGRTRSLRPVRPSHYRAFQRALGERVKGWRAAERCQVPPCGHIREWSIVSRRLDAG